MMSIYSSSPTVLLATLLGFLFVFQIKVDLAFGRLCNFVYLYFTYFTYYVVFDEKSRWHCGAIIQVCTCSTAHVTFEPGAVELGRLFGQVRVFLSVKEHANSFFILGSGFAF